MADITSPSSRRLDYMRLDEVLPADRNPKLHDQDVIAGLIDDLGYIEPMIEMVDPETGKSIDMGPYAVGAEWERTPIGATSDKYMNLSRPDPARPCPTVTAAGGGISTASVTHPTQMRKFNLQELRAVCSFPADFQLTGTYDQRWERLGRSVPPLMMRAIASSVRDLLQEIDRGT